MAKKLVAKINHRPARGESLSESGPQEKGGNRAMICQCGAEIPDGQVYCGQCGSKAEADKLLGIQRELEILQRRLGELSQAKVTEQRFLEMDTTEKIVSRVQKWFKLFIFFVGIPLVLGLFFVGIFLQREVRSLHDLASTGLESLKKILEATRKDAESVQTEVTSVAKQTRQQLVDLKTEVGNRGTEVRQLNEEIQKSKAAMEGLAKALATQSKEIKAVAQQVKTVATEKNIQLARDAYPAALGERVAGSNRGTIDPSKKGSQDVYVSLTLSVASRQQSKLDAAKFGQIMTTLEERNYTVFQRGVYLHATSGTHTASLGPEINDRSCQLAKLSPPCILYFRETLQAKAHEVRDLVRTAQIVPDDRIKFVDPKQLESGLQELLQRSALDIVLVLSG
jgi:hypothetical protein